MAGLHIQAQLDTNSYARGIKVSDEELAAVRLEPKTRFMANGTVTPISPKS